MGISKNLDFFILKEYIVYFIELMLSIFKETTVRMFMLTFSAPFMPLILLHNLFFPPF